MSLLVPFFRLFFPPQPKKKEPKTELYSEHPYRESIAPVRLDLVHYCKTCDALVERRMRGTMYDPSKRPSWWSYLCEDEEPK